ncbi:5-dehydro-4-deoxyglucarate dehydratase [Salinicola rhizosphaerae]|uniref:5-dehydro-4-deoxyglucarate dehydratase n=1 Tax=Salinicola rhizosphaerae TaxID=1443141 RepID=A0ABQ3DT60_9GAMM|nr:5-dehydro-4-deoxyglucarate dehydratase [Salinicola rhizosphaerae]GHB15220.1 putative 5-dehydro-4-deoxyglucarate dehydratase [Salinicola rhizosphaerae]
MNFSREAVVASITDGLLSFPVTDFDDNGKFDAESYRRRLLWLKEYEVSALFVAGGTGEFFNLTIDEYREIVKVAVDTIGGHVPIIASAGQSAELAKAHCQAAKEAGADGILLMPPYLTECPEEGIVEYAASVCASTDLNIIYYNRANGYLHVDAVKALAERCPNLVGLKDGKGDMQALNIIIKTLGDRLAYVGGVPTAEIIAEAYLAIGVSTYSSAVFNFVPAMAVKFYQELRKGNSDFIRQATRDFFVPFVTLRDTRKGYAVSLIKAGAELVGYPGGSVRAPLTMPSEQEMATLKKLIDKAESL